MPCASICVRRMPGTKTPLEALVTAGPPGAPVCSDDSLASIMLAEQGQHMCRKDQTVTHEHLLSTCMAEKRVCWTPRSGQCGAGLAKVSVHARTAAAVCMACHAVSAWCICSCSQSSLAQQPARTYYVPLSCQEHALRVTSQGSRQTAGLSCTVSEQTRKVAGWQLRQQCTHACIFDGLT